MSYSKNIPADEALQLLQEGNERFVQGLRSVDSMIRSRDLRELAEKGQKPFAIVLACADSRVPTEILFDRGPGDIFVCRVAGNIAAPAIMGSIEFAAESFGSAICVVMGHTHCGAISAALKMNEIPPGISPNLRRVIEQIDPAVSSCRQSGEMTAEVLRHATWLNVFHTIETIRKQSSVIDGLVRDGKLTLVGALCDISNGSVSFEQPKLRRLGDRPSSPRELAVQA